MSNLLQRAALYYFDEGLCVIPITPGEKKPAIDWEFYHTRRPARDEVVRWWTTNPQFNIGIVHGAVSGNMVSLDIDHDAGVFKMLQAQFPELLSGRIEQSGSKQGYHVPLIVEQLPDFGFDLKRGREKGNKTWKTPHGAVNIRARFCQTVVPPSIHPSGNPYTFIKKGEIAKTQSLLSLINWLESLLPKSAKIAERGKRRSGVDVIGDSLLDAATSAWTTMEVFAHFGITGDVRNEPNGDIRILGNGGLVISPDTNDWYLFEADEGGGPIEAWAYLTFGSAQHKKKNIRAILLDMVHSAGGDVARFYRAGDEKLIDISTPNIETPWSAKYQGAWA